MRWICSAALIVILGAAGFAGEPDPAAPAAPPAAKAGRSPSAERAMQKWADFSARGAGWRVSWSTKTGLPRMIFGGKTKPHAGTPAEAARAFLEENADLVGVPAAAVAKVEPAAAASADPKAEPAAAASADPKAEPAAASAGGKAPGQIIAPEPRAVELREAEQAEILNGTRVSFLQYYRGIPVFNAECSICVDGGGAVWHVANSVHPDLSADVAAFDGANGLDLWMGKPEFEGKAPQLRGEPERVIYPEGPGKPALKLKCRFSGRPELWQVLIDAVTGDELRKVRLVLD
ncbi:MAG TPA: hypothetical protein VM223_28680 [Planctomycetota bacterium]|nr:hypothetical protein [Planctomycetota bacterium]